MAAQSENGVMIGQSIRLAIEMTAQLTAFTINLTLTGNLPHALELLAKSREEKRDAGIETENLFWD